MTLLRERPTRSLTEFLINPTRLAFHVPDMLAGLILAGNRGEGRLSGNGDCILLDGLLGLAALADGAERSPEASRVFLQSLADRMPASVAGGGADRGGDCLADAAQAVLDTFPYEERTTFLCLLPMADGSVSYVCGGDSLLFHLDPAGGRILFQNRSNMGFAGRSKKIMDSGLLPVREGDLLLLASDGLWDLLDGRRRDLIRFAFELLRQGPLHTFPERLVRGKHPAFQPGRERPFDDLSLMIIRPRRFAHLRSRVILGGTDKTGESRYRQLCQQQTLPDQAVPLPPRGPRLWMFPDHLHLLQV